MNKGGKIKVIETMVFLQYGGILACLLDVIITNRTFLSQEHFSWHIKLCISWKFCVLIFFFFFLRKGPIR